jgi:uncharacterized protein YprB with RNaseH-like and TPR domain
VNAQATIQEILFLDIETVPAYASLAEVPEELRELWIESQQARAKRRVEGNAQALQDVLCASETTTALESEFEYQNAGLKPEFGRIICVALGRYDGGGSEQHFRTHCIASDNERELLQEFSAVLSKYSNYYLCAHNGKGFDFPYLGKRILINALPLPAQLDTMGKKPWEIRHLDTHEMWAFGAKGPGMGAKLALLCAVFGIPSPKDDIDGSQVREIYYKEKDLARIARYCEKDVVSLAKVYRRMQGI